MVGGKGSIPPFLKVKKLRRRSAVSAAPPVLKKKKIRHVFKVGKPLIRRAPVKRILPDER